jgi:hypothetical protein
LLLLAVHHVLDGGDIDAHMEFPIARINARGRFDDVRNVKRLRASMADTHEFVVAGVKDDDSPIDPYGLCPRLQSRMSALF